MKTHRSVRQKKQKEWSGQWNLIKRNDIPKLDDWICPSRIEDFSGKDVLECGCGGGHHTPIFAKYAKTVTAVDLNSINAARQKNKSLKNVKFVADDIATMNLGKKFDIVLSIGVVHVTDNPEKTVANMIKHTKKGGRVIIWVYSEEGNLIQIRIIEPLKQKFLRKISLENLLSLSKIVTIGICIPAYSIYLLPLKFLPYYEELKQFRKYSFNRKHTVIFDMLNSPQTQFISKARAESWMKTLTDTQLCHHNGIAWIISGTKPHSGKTKHSEK